MKKEEFREIAMRMKERRKALKYTQHQFAEMINLSYSSYSKIENAEQKASLNTLIKISNGLNLSLNDIIYGENEGKNISNISVTDKMEVLLKYCGVEKLKHTVEVLTLLIKIKDEMDNFHD